MRGELVRVYKCLDYLLKLHKTEQQIRPGLLAGDRFLLNDTMERPLYQGSTVRLTWEYSRTKVTRTLTGNEKQFELSGLIEYSICHLNNR